MTTSELSAAVVEQAPDAIIATDASGSVQIWNERAAQIFGFSREEAVKGGLDLIVPAGLRAAHWRGFRNAMAAGKATSRAAAVLTRAVHKDGRRLYVELSFSILVNAAGTAIGAIAVAREAPTRRTAGDPKAAA